MYRNPLRLAWVPTYGDDIPQSAVVGGNDNTSHEGLFIGRAMHEKCLIPGKVPRSHSCLYIPYGGKEIPIKDYEILVSDNHSGLHWIPQSSGNYPHNAIKGGFEKDTIMYVARAKAPDGGLCIGKLHPEHRVCYIPWGGKEHACHEYDVLTCV